MLLPLLVATVVASTALCALVALRRDAGWEIPVLSAVALAGSLLAVARQRSQRSELLARTSTRERQLTRMSETLKAREEKAQALERRVDDMTKLYRAISTVNSVQDPSYAYASVVAAALELVGGDRGSLMLLDEARQALVIRSHRGLSEDVLDGTRVPLGWVVLNEQPILLVGKASDDRRFDRAENRPVRSALCVPLQCHREVIGVLNLACSTASPKTTFDESDKNLTHIFAQHAAVTVRFVQLWERVPA
jgi:transcriptional regulator with GAF, ATPase, and Fis domain